MASLFIFEFLLENQVVIIIDKVIILVVRPSDIYKKIYNIDEFEIID